MSRKQIKPGIHCQENWDGMTPTSQGAFCASCAKEVIDFTNFSDQELILFFQNYSENSICGRIYSHQVDFVNEELNFFSQNAVQDVQTKFILALFLIFGLSLFSCKTGEQAFDKLPDAQVQSGRIDSVENTVSFISDTINKAPGLTNTNAAEPEESFIPGDIHFEPNLYLRKNLWYPVQLEPTLGVIAIFQGDLISVPIGPDDVGPTPKSVVLDMLPPYNTLEQKLMTDEIRVAPYPEVVRGSTSLVVHYSGGNLEAAIRNPEGKLQENITVTPLNEATWSVPIDLTNYANGVYFICLSGGDSQLVVRLVKSNTREA